MRTVILLAACMIVNAVNPELWEIYYGDFSWFCSLVFLTVVLLVADTYEIIKY